MIKAYKSIITTFFILFFTLTIGTLGIKTYASEKFSVEHDVIYEIQTDGITLVKQNITITNQENDVIATNYSLTTKYLDVIEEKGYEDENNMPVKKENSEQGTKLTAIFNNVAIGKGNTKKFTITYKTKDIMTKTGNVWNINIPKSEITGATTLYNVQLVIPKELGNKLFISPEPQVFKDTTETQTTYYFTKENLLTTGITAAFGTYQTLNFKLDYQLKNDNFMNAIYEIAIPTDIKDYQQVSYKEISPKPEKMYLDKDGNLIAQYWVKGKDTLDIEVRGSVKLITKQIKLHEGGNFKNIPRELISKYTKEDTYWETSSKIVINLKDKLYKNDQNVSQNAFNIYEYIVNNFEYDTNVEKKSYIDRKGAYNSISTREPMACMEFTDIFVTLARAMGIPAREINGYAINSDNNKNTPASINIKGGDLLHSWAEYYDPNFGWVQIDPTWGNTSKIDYFSKLDTNHFGFVVRGLDSESPLPAGMYRYENNKKLISIDFSNIDSNIFEPKLEVKNVFNISPIHWILGYKRYEITNTGNVFVYGLNNKTLAPEEKAKIYINKNTKGLSYSDFKGSSHILKIQ